MSKVFSAQAQHGKLFFGSEANHIRFVEWLKRNHGIFLKITPNEDISTNLRKFFEGGIVPMVALQHRVGEKPMAFEETREMLKLEFNPKYVRKTDGTRVIIGGSTATMNKARFQKFVDMILDWMASNGYEVPDPEDYKVWRDSAPAPGEIYPPIARLLELYKKERQSV